MKLLIAITSCHNHRAWQQAQRDTWIKDIPAGVDYKFFLGGPCPDDARPDEVFLNVPDDYLALSEKTKAIMGWATDRAYDFIYKTDVDTLVVPAKLLSSGFEQYDYMGGLFHTPDLNWASGGSGYVLSAKAARFVAAADITIPYEDVQTAKVCYANGLTLHGDPQFKYMPGAALTKGTVSYHLSSVYGWRQDPKSVPYSPALMYAAYGATKKVLIAINSWVMGSLNGDNQAMRDTFLKGISKFPGWEYRFFIGDGTPTGDDETALQQSFIQGGTPACYKNKAVKSLTMTTLSSQFVQREDEVLLPVPDDYGHLTYKTRENRRWANEHGFAFVFQCYPDTYIHLDRLASSGFQNHDYSGTSCGTYLAGGAGYWTSRLLSEFIVDTPVTDFAEDRWVGAIARAHGIPMHVDPRYADYPKRPQEDNDIITSHFAHTPKAYNNTLMFSTHSTYATKLKPIHAHTGYCKKHIRLGCLECTTNNCYD